MNQTAFPRPRRATVYRERSESVKSLMSALAKAMAEFQPLVRDCEGSVVRNGRPTKYRYASADSINRSTRPALLKYGIVITQEYCVSDEGITQVTSMQLGDEFITSTLPVRQYEDIQRQKAHMSYMRRTAIEGLLCLSAEEDGDGQDAVGPEPAKANASWAAQEKLALDAVNAAKTPAELEGIRKKVLAKVDNGDMDPHSNGRVEEAIDARFKRLKQEAAKSSPKAVVA